MEIEPGVSNPFKAGLFLCHIKHHNHKRKAACFKPLQSGAFFVSSLEDDIPRAIRPGFKPLQSGAFFVSSPRRETKPRKSEFQTPSKRGFFCVYRENACTLPGLLVSNPFKAGLFLCRILFRLSSRGGLCFKPLQSGAFFVSATMCRSCSVYRRFQTPSKRGFFCVYPARVAGDRVQVSNPFKAGLFLCRVRRSAARTGPRRFKPLQSGAFFVSNGGGPLRIIAARFKPLQSGAFFVSRRPLRGDA